MCMRNYEVRIRWNTEIFMQNIFLVLISGIFKFSISYAHNILPKQHFIFKILFEFLRFQYSFI